MSNTMDVFHAILELESSIFEEYLRYRPDSGISPSPAPFDGVSIRSRSRLRRHPTQQRWISSSPMRRDHSRSPVQCASPSSPPMSERNDITWAPPPATVASSPIPSMTDTIIVSSAGAVNERVLTPVPSSEYASCSLSSDLLADLDEEEEEEVTLRDVNAKVRLHREEAATATHTSHNLCEKICIIMLGEVRGLRALVWHLCDVILPPPAE
ncbi:hypothetical protein PR048_000337 [Dryococelus australis]|uniref:Uncharacterized protein n=1 Tax=Dryococelus australis TaxID=614101 RepID=A0ABQ9IEX1_9NEOP|nr:hypothetical protein PR048_000337 [Dryococelus australis]